MHKREICLLAAILIGILVLGFTVTMGSFADNLLASAADVIVGIFIVLYLVDRISRRERARKLGARRATYISFYRIGLRSNDVHFSNYDGCGNGHELGRCKDASGDKEGF